jgi:hypothetical protein
VAAGVISSVDDPDGVLTGIGISVGTRFTGGVMWDTTLVDGNPDPDKGHYEAAPGSNRIGWSMTVAGESFELDPSRPAFANTTDDSGIGPGLDAISVVGNGLLDTLPDGLGKPRGTFSEMVLVDGSKTALSSDALPLGLDLAQWDRAEFRLVVSRAATYALVIGTIESLTQVPEPGTAVLFALGTGFSAAASRRSLRGRARVG